jgi:hypothetical protein
MPPEAFNASIAAPLSARWVHRGSPVPIMVAAGQGRPLTVSAAIAADSYPPYVPTAATLLLRSPVTARAAASSVVGAGKD